MVLNTRVFVLSKTRCNDRIMERPTEQQLPTIYGKTADGTMEHLVLRKVDRFGLRFGF